MPTTAEGLPEGRYSTPTTTGKKDTSASAKEAEIGAVADNYDSPPPLAAPLSDDTLEEIHGTEIEKAAAESSPFAATPSPISGGARDTDRIDGAFDTGGSSSGTSSSISRTLDISEIDESLLNATSGADRRHSDNTNNTNNTTLQSVLELSELETTLDGAALRRTIGGGSEGEVDVSSDPDNRSASYRARDLSEIDTTMDVLHGGDGGGEGAATSANSNANTDLVEEDDENSTLAGQMYVGSAAASVGGGSRGSSYQYSVGGGSGFTANTTGTDIADFLRKQNEAMQKTLAASGASVGIGKDDDDDTTAEEQVISPTKTRAVDKAVANARIMAEATAILSSSNEKVVVKSMPSPSAATSAAATASTRTGAGSSKQTATSFKTSSAASSSSYQSQYALSPSQRAKESMTTAEKLRRAEVEAMARGGGPTYEKMDLISENDDDYVPIADYSTSAKKLAKGGAGPSVGSFAYSDYAPDTGMASPGSAVDRYRQLQRRRRRRRQRRLIRAGIVMVILTAGLFWWYQNDRGEASSIPNSSQDMVGAVAEDSLSVGDVAVEDSTETEDVSHSSDVDNVADAVAAEPLFVSTFKREKIQLLNADKAPIVKLFNAAKTTLTSAAKSPRVPFSHFWNKEVRTTAKAQPVLSGLDDLLDTMMQ